MEKRTNGKHARVESSREAAKQKIEMKEEEEKKKSKITKRKKSTAKQRQQQTIMWHSFAGEKTTHDEQKEEK